MDAIEKDQSTTDGTMERIEQRAMSMCFAFVWLGGSKAVANFDSALLIINLNPLSPPTLSKCPPPTAIHTHTVSFGLTTSDQKGERGEREVRVGGGSSLF